MTGKYPPGPRDAVFGMTYLHRLRSAPLAFVTEVARVMEYAAAHDLYRDDVETVQVSSAL